MTMRPSRYAHHRPDRTPVNSTAESPMSDALAHQPLAFGILTLTGRELACYNKWQATCEGAPVADSLATDVDRVAATIVANGSPLRRAGWAGLVEAAQSTTAALTDTPELLAAAREFDREDFALVVGLAKAVLAASFVTGMPTLETLPSADLPSFLTLTRIVEQRIDELDGMVDGSPARQQLENTPINWTDIVAGRARHAMQLQNQANISAPVFTGRKDTPFARSFDAMIPDEVKDVITKLFVDAAPGLTRAEQMLNAEPCGVTHLCKALARSAHHLDLNLGRNNADGDEYLMAPTLVALGGLGMAALAAVAAVRESNGEVGWDKVATWTQSKLAEEITSARAMSGYPASLFLVDFGTFQRACLNHGLDPSFTSALAILHVLKYARLIKVIDGYLVRVAYNGVLVDIPVAEKGLRQPLTAVENRNLSDTLNQVLGFPRERGKNVTQLQSSIMAALGSIVVETLPTVEELPASLIAAELVTLVPDTRRAGSAWITPGLTIPNIRKIDIATGVVTVTRLQEDKVLQYRLKYAEVATGYNAATSAGFYGRVPEIVLPALPGDDLMNRYFRNITRIVEGKDLTITIARFFDLIVVANLVRKHLAGSRIAGAMEKEFPGVFSCAETAGETETTGQGKTSLVRELANLAVPGIREIRVSRQAGDVKQRAAAHDLMAHGILLVDEFRIAERAEYDTWCDREGLCALLTGGGVPVGRAGKNDASASLYFSPFFCGKYYQLPKDLILRTVPIRLGHFTEETRTDEADAELLNSGGLARLMRLGALVFIEQRGLVERLRQAPLGPTDLRFRFPGYLGIYIELFGRVSLNEFLDGIEQLRNAALKVRAEASRSGKLAANGQGDELDPALLLSVVSEDDLWDLHLRWKMGPVAPTTALAEIMRAGSGDTYSDASLSRLLQPYHATVPTANARFVTALANPVETSHGWTLRLVNERHPTAKKQRPRVYLDPPEGEVPSENSRAGMLHLAQYPLPTAPQIRRDDTSNRPINGGHP